MNVDAPALSFISGFDMKNKHNNKGNPADYEKPDRVCVGDDKRQQSENNRPYSGQQYPDDPEAETRFLQKQKQREHHYAGQQAERRVEGEKVVAAYAGYDAEGDAVKDNNMPDEKAHHHDDKADCKGEN